MLSLRALKPRWARSISGLPKSSQNVFAFNTASIGWNGLGQHLSSRENLSFSSKADRDRDYRKEKAEKNRNNFDRRVLLPASRGLLIQKHKSGIPKLAARRNKAKLVHHTSRPPIMIEDDENNSEYDLEESDLSYNSGSQGEYVTGSHGPHYTDQSLFTKDELNRLDYYAPHLIDDDRYFWREEDYEEHKVPDLVLDEDGGFTVDYSEDAYKFTEVRDPLEFMEGIDVSDDEDEDDEFDEDEDDEFDEEEFENVVLDENFETEAADEDPKKKKKFSGLDDDLEMIDPEDFFFSEQNDVLYLAGLDDEEFSDDEEEEGDGLKTILPLKETGTGIDGFLEDVMDHPADYVSITRNYLHRESRREPVPDFPNGRKHPSLEFVESFKRYLFVTGLPPFELDGQPGDINNPVHKSLVEKSIASLFDIDSSTVYAVSNFSGFVGFDSPKDLAMTLSKGPRVSSVSSNATLSKYNGSDDNEFYMVSPECTVALTGIPGGHTQESLAQDLFPGGTEVGTAYGGLSPQNFFFLSSSSALIRFESDAQAQSALESYLVRERLKEFGQCSVQYFRARRELLFDGFGGPGKGEEKRKMGPRLIVDCDMPGKKFYLSHAGVLKIRNLDPSLTAVEISAAFQPFSTLRRDIFGSIQFVSCEAGLPTGMSFIGFDVPGDSEAAISKLNGRIKLGGRTAILNLMKDRKVPHRPSFSPERRSDRTSEELLYDLHGWEQYVNPDDIKALEEAGVSKLILDEAFRTIRYKNATFGPLDSAKRSEALQPEREFGGMYKEMVQLYIKALKECIATPEDVGDIYKALHFPDEPIDLTIFDREKNRQQRILEDKVSS